MVAPPSHGRALERNVFALAVTVVTVLGAIQQDKSAGIHVEAWLGRTALVNSSVT